MMRLVNNSDGAEVFKNPQSCSAGFFRMELRAEDVVSLHDCRESSAVMRASGCLLHHRSAERVGVVDKCAVLDSAQQSGIVPQRNSVPAHMGRFHFRRKPGALPGEERSAGGLWSFSAALKEPLHPNANSQKGNTGRNRLEDSRTEFAVKALAAAKMSDARHDQLFGLGDHFRIIGDLDLGL